MAAGNIRTADPVDTQHHEIDSAVHSHHVYKSVRVNASNRRKTRPREGVYWPIHMMNLQYVAVIKDSQIVGSNPLEIYSQITWYYITRRGPVVRCPVSVILLGEGGKEKAWKYHVNIVIIVDPQRPGIIQDPAFIYNIMLFLKVTKRDQAFIQDRPYFEAIRYIHMSTVLFYPLAYCYTYIITSI